MRRLLSIFFAVLLGLGPAMAAIPADALTASSSESSLPACCRKNGVHHCAMHAQAAAGSHEITLSAANCCPCWPGSLASSATESAAVVHAPQTHLATTAERLAAPRSKTTPARTPQHTEPQRGPPSQS